MSGPRVALITGAGGFVGRHLLQELERETDWRLIGTETRRAAPGARVHIVKCDLRDSGLVERLVARHRPDVIFHLAAQSYVPKAVAAPGDTISNNVLGQAHLLEASRKAGIDPVILVVGSSEEYGHVESDELPVREEQPFRPANPYAVSKIAQDMLGLQYAISYGMQIVRVRPFNHFGPGQSDRFVLATFARQIAEVEAGLIEPAVLTGNLDARRDFLDVRDVVRAYRLAVDGARPGEVYNVASGMAWRIGDLLEQLIGMARVPVSVQHDPARMRPSDTPVIVGDATRFRAATGWSPSIPIDVSLRDTLDYWRDVVSRRDGPGAQ